MYKKVKRSFNDPYGIKDDLIKDFNRPFVFFCVPSGSVKGINGYLNSLIYMLRLRKGENINAGLDISEVPFDLYCSSKKETDVFIQIIDKVDINDLEALTKIIRNINFVSYCDGNNKLLPIIESIHNKLLEKGLSEEVVNNLMKQISVLQIVDNLGYDGDDFPYVTTISIHNRHDVENSRWLEEDLESKEGQFSKAFVKRLTANKEVVVVEPFGEGSLQVDNEHSYTDDYLRSPVINALMSVCLVESISSSLQGRQISLTYFKDGIDYILKTAHEYEIKIGKDLDSLTKEDLDKFNQYMMEIMTKYVKDKFKIKKSNFEKIIEEEKVLKNNALVLAYDYKSDIKSVVDRILLFNDKNVEEVCTEYIGNNKYTLPIKSIVSIYYDKLIQSVKNNIQDINNIIFKGLENEEMNIQLVEWKKDKINEIYQLLDNELLRKCGLNIEENMKL